VMDIFDPRFPWPAHAQRNRDYTRQRQVGIVDMLLDNRIVFLGTSPVASSIRSSPIRWANATIQHCSYLQYENRTQEIHFYINSAGRQRHLDAGHLRHDAVLECPISTYCVGTRRPGGHPAERRHSRQALCSAALAHHAHQPWGQSADRLRRPISA